jgi:uncharacterized membrane protein
VAFQLRLGGRPFAAVSEYQWALLFHFGGVLLFYGGQIVAVLALATARRRRRTADVAALLSLAPLGVVLVGAGAVVALVTGFWLLEVTGRGLGDGWIALALGLLVASTILGAAGSRSPKRARKLAERGAPDEDPELRRLLHDPVSRGLNAAAAAAALAILVLMVWRPDL